MLPRAGGLTMLLLFATLAVACRPASQRTVPREPGPVDPSPAPAPGAPRLPPIDPDDTSWTKLGAAAPGSWRGRFPDDRPMDFDEYVESDPVRADGPQNVIAFLPVGDFGEEQRAALDAAAEFAGIWFDLPVRVLPPVALTENPGWSRMRPTPTGNGTMRQFRTGWFLDDLLPDRRPEDAVVLLGVTMADLYPERSWNYVFGQAHLVRRVGVYSLARYFPEFWGETASPAASRTALLRTLKVVTHEAGHTFGLEHCVTWACCMNGSNSLDETDGQPLHLCPDCLRKLAWNRGLDVGARDRRIAEFLDGRGLAAEAAWHRDRATRR